MSLATELAARLRARIDAGELAPGERLPAVRDLAAHGARVARGRRRGLRAAAARGPARLARRPRHVRRAARARAAARSSTWRPTGRPARRLGVARPAGAPRRRRAARCDQPLGRPARSSTPRSRPRSAAELEAVVREEGARLFQYGPPRGDAGLRELVAERLAPRGYDADPERILVTTSGQQAIDLAVRALVEPGDAVLCETPTYAGAIDALVAARARIVPVPDRRARPARRARRARPSRPSAPPRSSSTRPATTPPAPCCRPSAARALAALAAETGLVVIEDDTGAELVHDGPVPPPVAAGDPEAPVVLVKSYAKTVLPGLRLGVISAPPSLERRVLAAKMVADRYTAPPLARALARYLGRPRRRRPPRARARHLPRAARRVPARAGAAAGRPRDVARAARPASTSGCGCPTAPARRRSSPGRRSAASSSRPAASTSRRASATSHLRLSLLHGDAGGGRSRAAAAGAGPARRDRRPAPRPQPRGRRPRGVAARRGRLPACGVAVRG